MKSERWSPSGRWSPQEIDQVFIHLENEVRGAKAIRRALERIKEETDNPKAGKTPESLILFINDLAREVLEANQSMQEIERLKEENRLLKSELAGIQVEGAAVFYAKHAVGLKERKAELERELLATQAALSQVRGMLDRLNLARG